MSTTFGSTSVEHMLKQMLKPFKQALIMSCAQIEVELIGQPNYDTHVP